MLGLQKYNTGGLVNWWETKEKSSCFLNLTNYNCEQFTYTHNGHKCQCNLEGFNYFFQLFFSQVK